MSRRRRARRPAGQTWLVNLLLRGCDLLRPLFLLAGVQYEMFREMLRVKLLLDARSGAERTAKNLMKRPGLLWLIFSSFMGGMVMGALVFFAVDSSFLRMILLVTGSGLMLWAFLVVDFTQSVVDTSDLPIVEAFPVRGATLSAVRMMHVGIYVLVLQVAGLIGPVLFCLLTQAAWVHLPVLLFSYLAVGVGATALLFGVYQGFLRLAGPARFRDWVLTLQIAVLASVYGISQLGPIVLEAVPPQYFLGEQPWALAALPPAWYGGLLRLAMGNVTGFNVLLSTLALGAPLLVIGSMRWIAGDRMITLLRAVDQVSEPEGSAPRRRGISGWWRDRCCQTPLERAGFDHLWVNVRTDRGFRLRTYGPTAIMTIAFGVAWARLGFDHRFMAVFPWIPVFAAVGASVQSRYGEDPEGAWPLEMLDARQGREFHRGCFLGVLACFYLTPTLYFLALALPWFGLRGALHLVTAAAAGSILATRALPGLVPRAPFSERFRQSSFDSQTGTAILLMLVILAASGAQIMVFQWTPLRWAFVLLVGAWAAIALYGSLFRARESN